jgi:hypothetical protein
MIPQPFTLDGRIGMVVYLDAHWHPVPPEKATMAKVLWDDGDVAFFVTSVQSVAKFDPNQPRDKSGRWTYGSHETKWAVNGYVQGVGQSINAYLREGASAPHGAAPDWAREYVVLMDEHMQRNHLPEDTSLTRTISNKRAEELNVGDIYQDNGYVSTTRNASRIHDIRDDIGASSEYQAIMTIQAPKGLGHIDVNKEIGNDHRYAHQNEIILPRGTKFQVVSKQILGRWGNKMIVKVVP